MYAHEIIDKNVAALTTKVGLPTAIISPCNYSHRVLFFSQCVLS